MRGRTWIAPLLLAVAAAVVMATLLGWLARPSQFSARAESLDRQTAELIARSRSGAAGAHRFAADTVCHDGPEQAAAALRGRMQALAASSGVSVTGLLVNPHAQGPGGSMLAPVSVSFQADGGYEQVVALLQGLAAQKPGLFIDQADLRSRVSSVNLQVKGWLFCAVT